MPDKQNLLAAIKQAEAQAYGSETNGNLSAVRARSIEDYLGEPYGNEVEGQSQVISRDVYDAIEWIKPKIMRIFTGGDSVCRFDPRGPEDEEQAKQETEYINYVITQKNEWFRTFLEWFTDAAISKNAYAMAYWDEKVDTEKESYTNLTDDEFAMLVNEEGVEIEAHTATPDEQGAQMVMQQWQQIAMQAQAQGMEPPPQPQPPMFHDVDIRRTNKREQVRIQVLPPERCKVSEITPSFSVRGSPYFEYWEWKPLSWFKEMGYEPTEAQDHGEGDTVEDAARNTYFEAGRDSQNTVDPAMRMYKARMVWIRHDYNEDGIAEQLYVFMAGNEILSIDECNTIPVASIVPIPLPHRHIGLSIRDLVTDIQFTNTVIWRQALNNLYLSNNGRYAVSGKVNLSDMLTSRAGGIVRVDGIPQQEIFPFTHPQTGQQAVAFMDYQNRIAESRTGAVKNFSGNDAQALQANVGTMAQMTSLGSEKIELIARITAEGVKELFQVVHELVLKHGHKKQMVRLSNKWVEVDPAQWRKRTDLTLSVGVGVGNKEVMSQNLMNIYAAQKEALPLGVATPKNIFNTLSELTKNNGFPAAERFWTDPEMQPPPQQQDPNAALVMVEKYKADKAAETTLKKAAMDNQTKKEVEVIKIKGEMTSTAQKSQLERKPEAPKMPQLHPADQMAHEERKALYGAAAQVLAAKAKANPKDGLKPATEMHNVQKMAHSMIGGTVEQEAAQKTPEESRVEALAQAMHQGLMHVAEAMKAPREVVRDPKTGRAVGTRVVG